MIFKLNLKTIILNILFLSVVFADNLEKRAYKAHLTVTIRDVWLCTRSKGLESCGWVADCSTFKVFDYSQNKETYNGKVCCTMGIKCCTDDGHYCYKDYRWQDNAYAYYFGGNVKLSHSKAHKTIKEKQVGLKNVKSTGYQYIWETDTV